MTQEIVLVIESMHPILESRIKTYFFIYKIEDNSKQCGNSNIINHNQFLFLFYQAKQKKIPSNKEVNGKEEDKTSTLFEPYNL